MFTPGSFTFLVYSIVFFGATLSFGQGARQGGEYGYPYITNYSPKDYNGHAQTWELTQTKDGLIYVGTSEGILEYDGNLWNKVKLTNLSGVRSVYASDNRVYHGGSGEFGYLYHDPSGITQFQSLREKLPTDMSDLSEIFDVIKIGNEVFYRSVNALIVYNEQSETIKVLRPKTEFGSAFLFQGDLMVYTPDEGFLRYVPGETQNLQQIPSLPSEGFRAFLEWDEKTQIFLYSDGFYSYDGQSLEKMKTGIIPGNLRKVKTKMIKLNEHSFALIANDIYVFNSTGKLLSTISEKDGLADVNLHDAFLDRDGALWVSSNFGLSRISFHIPIRRFDERNGIFDTVNDIIRFGDHLFVSTHTGLYRFNPDVSPEFIETGDPIGESFALELVGDELWVSTSNGVFSSKNGLQFVRISKYSAYKFQKSQRDHSLVFIGSTQGLILTKLATKGLHHNLSYQDIFPYDTRYMNQDSLDNLWIGTMDNRLFMLDFFNKGTLDDPVIAEYGPDDGLPYSHIQVNKIQNELIFSSEYGIYDFDNVRFTESIRFPSLPTIVYYLYEASDKTIYVLWGEPPFMKISPFLIDGSDRFPPADIPELKTVETTGVWVAYEDRDGTIWFGLSDGLLNFRPKAYNPKETEFVTTISTIKLNTDSLIAQHVHGDYFSLNPKIDYGNNSVRFDYSMVSFENENLNQFSYKLSGQDEGWSAWSTDKTKEYVGLREGNYNFQLRSVNVFGQQGQPVSFRFEILPPWYRAIWFLMILGIVLLPLFVWVIRFFATRKLIHRVEELEMQQKVQVERERISRDLHDSVGTHFAYIISKLDYLYLGWNRDQITDKKDYLGKVSDFARSGMRMLRETIWALNQSEIETNSLKAKIQDYLQLCFASETSSFYFKMTSNTKAVNSTVALNCFRIIQEAVSNSLKHAKAKEHTVNFHIEDQEHFELYIIDNGNGFDVKDGREKVNHYGLNNLSSRSKEMGAQLEIESDVTGTRISVIKE